MLRKAGNTKKVPQEWQQQEPYLETGPTEQIDKVELRGNDREDEIISRDPGLETQSPRSQKHDHQHQEGRAQSEITQPTLMRLRFRETPVTVEVGLANRQEDPNLILIETLRTNRGLR